jgi:glutamate N-acetyltransferase/amino-acid N-acetyltransferase
VPSPAHDHRRLTALPSGFVAHVGYAGLRAGGANDIAVLRSLGPCASAGVFTKSRFSGPSVELSRPRAAAGTASAIVVVASNANVATGARGQADAAELAALAAAAGGVQATEQLVASTGVIGRHYPMPLLRDYLGRLHPGDGASWDADAGDVATAMMTTDTVAKVATRQVGAARVVGMAKGVGMIEPDMATMLAFVVTDAEVAPDVLERIWRRATDETFNCLSVDTDTSTSDTAVVLAGGAAGPVPEAAIGVAIREVCLDLTLQLARDAEGATKLITVTVRAARDRDQARRVSKAIVNSPLVKTAVYGADPNWGRVAMAVGKCSDDTDIDQDRVVIRFGDLEAYPAIPGPDGLAALAEVMAADHVDIDVELGTGDAEATAYGCDLTEGYIRINADYTT